MRWAWADVDLDAIASNVRFVRDIVQPSKVWAVVKADAYGHGAVPVARAAVGAGAEGLCVALVQEGVELRDAGIEQPILVLSEQPHEELDELVINRLTATLYSLDGVVALADAVQRVGHSNRQQAHLKIDTGMHRLGAQPGDALMIADAIADHPLLELQGVFTHLAMADEPTAKANALQVQRFDWVVAALKEAGHRPPLVHVANSAGALALADTRHSLVRVGIAMYGIVPGHRLGEMCADLQPSLSLVSRVGHVKRVVAGEGISYGLRHTVTHETTIATVPVGYADGVPRRLFANGGEVLIGGIRRPIVGVVTMDQLMVDCGDDAIGVGDEVVLIGRQASEHGSGEIRAEEWADRLGTIGYEVVCGISKRVERRYS